MFEKLFAADGVTGNEPVAEPKVSPVTEPKVEPVAEPKADPEPKATPTILADKKNGAEPKAEPKADVPYWPEDWRENLAEREANGDEKIKAKVLKQLERYVDPGSIFSKAREAEGQLTSGNLIKVPGKNATEEEIADYRKATGWLENSEDYFKDMKLENGAIIGAADKPFVDEFTAAVHKEGATPAMVKAGLDWYYGNLEKEAVTLDKQDAENHDETKRELKEEYGSAFNRYTNSVASLFSTAPGGSDPEGDSLYADLMGGRLANGRLIGDDPNVIRFLVSLAREINPIATVTEGGDQSGLGVEAELQKIAELRTTNKKEYSSAKVQARELELLEAQQKSRARA